MTEPHADPAAPEATVVTDPPLVRALLWAGLPALGLGAGWLLPRALDWVAARERLPLPGPLRLVAELPRPLVTVAALLAGVLAGLALAHRATTESLVLTVGAHAVQLRREGTTQEVARADVAAVFLDGDRLVLLDRDTTELATAPCEAYHARVAQAFLRHGYPWHPEGDPYESDYRRWVPGLPGLPPGADALFTARQRALERGDRADAAALRADLAALGLVVRDRDRRQYYRRTGRHHPRQDPGSS